MSMESFPEEPELALLKNNDLYKVSRAYRRLSELLDVGKTPNRISAIKWDTSRLTLSVEEPETDEQPFLASVQILGFLRSQTLKGSSRAASRKNAALAAMLGGEAIEDINQRMSDGSPSAETIRYISDSVRSLHTQLEDALDGIVNNTDVRAILAAVHKRLDLPEG
jgi:uncharacterized protein YoaH (UPF0181 family)